MFNLFNYEQGLLKHGAGAVRRGADRRVRQAEAVDFPDHHLLSEEKLRLQHGHLPRRLTGISDEYYEAAKIDGAGDLLIYWRIVLPLSVPGLVTIGISWAWRNPEYMLFEPSYGGVKAIFDELDKIAKPDIFTGFAEDYTEYQAERAALEQVEKQYLFPLLAGQVMSSKPTPSSGSSI